MNWNEIKERLKSPVVWTAVLMQVALIIALFNKELSETIKIIGTSIIEILTLFAILNNPSDKSNF
ncbi:MAG: holin [Clostridia bacterium]|nr:holin [Clostridia bacterium]